MGSCRSVPQPAAPATHPEGPTHELLAFEPRTALHRAGRVRIAAAQPRARRALDLHVAGVRPGVFQPQCRNPGDAGPVRVVGAGPGLQHGPRAQPAAGPRWAQHRRGSVGPGAGGDAEGFGSGRRHVRALGSAGHRPHARLSCQPCRARAVRRTLVADLPAGDLRAAPGAGADCGDFGRCPVRAGLVLGTLHSRRCRAGDGRPPRCGAMHRFADPQRRSADRHGHAGQRSRCVERHAPASAASPGAARRGQCHAVRAGAHSSPMGASGDAGHRCLAGGGGRCVARHHDCRHLAGGARPAAGRAPDRRLEISGRGARRVAALARPGRRSPRRTGTAIARAAR